jgi:putative FmdB family regulatory protein
VPTYDYQCRNCGQITEVVHAMTEDGPSTCERCGGPLRRVLYPTGIIFKGSGFYVTDSRSSANGARRSSGTARTSPGSSGGEGSSTETKPSGGSAADGGSKPEAKPKP